MPATARRALLGAALLTPAFLTPSLLAPARAQGPRVDPMKRPAPGPNPLPIRRAPLPGGALAYWDTGGEGQALLLNHPATGSHAVWGYQREAFAAAGYRVIAYSRRGYLDSESGTAPEGSSHSDDMAALLDHLAVDRVHAVGSAQGSIVSLDFALTRPDRVRSLTLSCTTMGVQDPAYLALSNSLRPEGFARMPSAFRELGPSYRAANPEGVAAWHALEAIAIPDRRVLQRSNVRVDWPTLGTVRPPVLLLGGDADLWAPPAIYRMFHAAMPGSELKIIPECGHAAHWEQPEAFNAAVLDFLGRHRD